MYYGNHSRYFSVLKVIFRNFLFQSESEILYKTIHQVSTRQCKKYWAVAVTIFYRIGYIKISNGRQYVTRPPAVFISRFFWSSASKHSYDTEFDLRKNVPGNNLRVPRYDSSLIYSTYDLKPIDLYLLSNTIQLFSERPNRPKLSSAEPRSFGQIHRSFGRSFGRTSGQKIRKNG